MELFLSNFVLFACISTHNLWRNKGFKFPWDLYWKNETYELKRSIVCFENLFIALLNSFSKCTLVVWNVWYNAYEVCFFREQKLKYLSFTSSFFHDTTPSNLCIVLSFQCVETLLLHVGEREERCQTNAACSPLHTKENNTTLVYGEVHQLPIGAPPRTTLIEINSGISAKVSSWENLIEKKSINETF